jgi:glucan 1,3-beta-glucosidase
MSFLTKGWRESLLGRRNVYTKQTLTPKTLAPNKPTSLLDDNGNYFTRSKPQYEDVSAGSIVVATSHGISNDGTGDQTAAINSLLSGNVGSLIFFPAGVYLVEGTVKIPVDSTIVGSGWSQIMATGSYFQDEDNPQIVVQVGKEGDVGAIEISDMVSFTARTTACDIGRLDS